MQACENPSFKKRRHSSAILYNHLQIIYVHKQYYIEMLFNTLEFENSELPQLYEYQWDTHLFNILETRDPA